MNNKYNLAAIDVGSNACRLLIKTIETDENGHKTARKALFLRVPLRLGTEVFSNGKISEEKTEEFYRTMKAYKQLMKVYHVKMYRACATSAMRDAKNSKEVMKKVIDKSGIELKTISGEEESRIIYDNHIQNVAEKGNYMYVDVGGGSTEMTYISEGKAIICHSFQIGTVRMINGKVRENDIQEMKEWLKRTTEGQ